LSGNARVGVTAGASAPEVLVSGVVECLKGLGAENIKNPGRRAGKRQFRLAEGAAEQVGNRISGQSVCCQYDPGAFDIAGGVDRRSVSNGEPATEVELILFSLLNQARATRSESTVRQRDRTAHEAHEENTLGA
jgi:hypothetical protein